MMNFQSDETLFYSTHLKDVKKMLYRLGIYYSVSRDQDKCTLELKLYTQIKSISSKVKIDFYREDDIIDFLNILKNIEKINYFGKKRIFLSTSNLYGFRNNLNGFRNSKLVFIDETGHLYDPNTIQNMAGMALYDANAIIRERIDKVLDSCNKFREYIYKHNFVKINYQNLIEMISKAKKLLSISQHSKFNEDIIEYNFDWYYISFNEFLLSNDIDLINSKLDELIFNLYEGKIIRNNNEKIPFKEVDDYLNAISVLDFIEEKIEALRKELLDIQIYNFDTYNNLKEAALDLNTLKFKSRKELKSIDPHMSDLKAFELSKCDYKEKNVKPIQMKSIFEDSWESYHTYDSIYNFDTLQEKKLSDDEKSAIMVYKTCFYQQINKVDDYVNQNNIDIDSIRDNKEIDEMLEAEYFNYRRDYNNGERFNISNKIIHLARIFRNISDKDGFISKENYKELILNSIILLRGALKKIPIEEDMIVYRGVSEFNIIPNHFLSTSLSLDVAKDFTKRKDNSKIEIYRFHLPAGSPAIMYTKRLFIGEPGMPNYLDDAQREILIDASLFDFKYNYVKEHCMINGQQIFISDVYANPKLSNENTKEKEHGSR